MSYENIWENGGVYRRYSNYITGQEIIQSNQEVHGHAQFDSINYVINDLLNVTEHNVSHNEIKRIVAIDKAAALTNPNIKVAIITVIPTIQELASMYSDLINQTPFSCKVFESIDEAREWAI